MSLISFSTISDGSTATASQVNTPLTTIYNDYNGNITAANLAANTLTVGTMATAINPETRFNENGFDYVASGCVWTGDSYGVNRNASMTAGVVYVGGRRTVVGAVTARTFTASKDTYIDVDNTGTITYTEVTNNAASPSLTAGNVRLGIIVTGAITIAAAGSVNQGQETMVLPIVSSVPYAVTDSLGNLICPRDPNRKILGYRQSIANQGSITAVVALTALSVPVIVPTGRKIKVSGYVGNAAIDTGDRQILMNLYDGTTTGGTLIATSDMNVSFATQTAACNPSAIATPTTASKNYIAGMSNNGGGGTITTNGAATAPNYIMVELI